MNEEERIPPQLQSQIAQLQQTQQQTQTLAMQRQQIEIVLRETERALDELEQQPGTVKLYKSIGGLLISGDKAQVMEELREQKETLDIGVKTLTKQEERLISRLKTLQEQATRGLKAAGYRAEG